MTDAEDQVRRYAAAMTRTQRPVELGEVVTRPKHQSARRPAVVAAALVIVVAIVATAVVIGQEHGSPARVEVAPTSSPSSAVAPAPNCPAASLTVTSTNGERMHAGWLPPGFVLTQGNESDLGARGGLTYSTPGNGDHPRVDISRERTVLPLATLYKGTSQPLTVHGHPGILSVSTPHVLPLTAILWRPTPDVALLVNGYELTNADLRRIADNLEYESGTTFRYPIQPAVTITRTDAFAAAGPEITDPHAALTSFGEVDAVITRTANHLPTLAPGVAVTRPVWVVWRAGVSTSASRAFVIDATTGAVVTSVARVSEHALDSLTDRSARACAPPFGVLTRSELMYIQPSNSGAHVVTRLTTERTLASLKSFSDFLQCSLDRCDPSVPVWVFLQSAVDHRFTDMESGVAARPTNTVPGSWSLTTVDARTGPTNTDLNGVSLGPGAPPADVLAVTDLAPG